MRWSTKVAAAERGRLVRWQDDSEAYQQLPSTAAPVVIEWQLSPGPGGTRLRLVHSGFGDGADWDDMYDGTKAGWTFFMWHLLETVRHHLGQQRTVVFERRPSTLTREALGARLFGSDGLALTPARPDTGSTASIPLDGEPRQFEVQHARLPTHLFGKFPELGGAVLLIEMEPGRSGPVQTGLWLSTWGLGSRGARVAPRQAPLGGRPRVWSPDRLILRTLPPAAALPSFGGLRRCAAHAGPRDHRR